MLTKELKNRIPAPEGVIFNQVKRIMAVVLLLFAGVPFFLTACGSTSENHASLGPSIPDLTVSDASLPRIPDPEALPSGSLTQDTASQSGSPSHSVPYFHDNGGKCIQSLNGYLYGYWNGQLCSYDSDTLKQNCYFSAVSDQSGQFCIYEDNLYFLERPHTSSLTNADTRLYMASLDGQEQKLLTSQVPNSTDEYIDYDDFYIYYEIDIYDDIIYLISPNRTDRVFYRLDRESESVTEIPESETLFGLLPEGYTEPFRYSRLPSLPCQMRHYGYLILMDADGNLAACDVESGRLEKITLPTGNIAANSVFLTHNALYCAEEAAYPQPLTTWYRISLDDLQTAEVWGQLSPMQDGGDEIFHDESGVYFVQKERGLVSLYQIPWDGSSMTLLYSRYLEGGESFPGPAYHYQYLYDVSDGFFYFNDKKGTQHCVMRTPLHGAAPETQVVAVYKEDPPETLYAYDTLEHRYSTKADTDDVTENLSCDTAFTRLFLTEDTAGSRAINASLEKLYDEISQELEDFEAECLSDSAIRPLPGMGSYMYVNACAGYLDEHYIGISIIHDVYYSGAAHPNYWWEEYVFDRRTGRRISITDIVENPPEQICEILSAYVEADHPGFRQQQDYQESVLEDFRFFLSEEGIGLHYNTYELASYAEGPDDYIIPFWEFDLKPDTVMYSEPKR